MHSSYWTDQQGPRLQAERRITRTLWGSTGRYAPWQGHHRITRTWGPRAPYTNPQSSVLPIGMTGQTQPTPSLWQNAQFRTYLGSTAFTGTAMAIQQLLISWLLVGILLLPGGQVGVAQALIGLPGILLLLLGGANADQIDPRTLLMRVYGVAWIFPAFLFAMVQLDLLNIWTVSLFGVGMSTAIAYANPAQQAILNRTAGGDVQRGVTAATAITFVVQIFGLMISGQMEIIGIEIVLFIQALSLVLGALAVRGIMAATASAHPSQKPTTQFIWEGLRVAYENRPVLHTLLITFVSGVFNFGAFTIAVPFIVKHSYGSDALGFATIMIIFYGGATVSNAIQYWIMPLARPGFWFLAMQATRAVILFGIWFQPSWGLLSVLMFIWGLNMGVTTNLGRAIVQETSPPDYLARLLSVLSVGVLGAMPIGAVILGFVIQGFGELNALLPAIVISMLLCGYGFFFTGLGQYQSPHVGANKGI